MPHNPAFCPSSPDISLDVKKCEAAQFPKENNFFAFQITLPEEMQAGGALLGVLHVDHFGLRQILLQIYYRYGGGVGQKNEGYIRYYADYSQKFDEAMRTNIHLFSENPQLKDVLLGRLKSTNLPRSRSGDDGYALTLFGDSNLQDAYFPHGRPELALNTTKEIEGYLPGFKFEPLALK